MQRANKLVSIIVPVYNCEKYIKKCLISILKQSYQNIEILVVNDGSTDNSQEIIDSLSQKDSRIRTIYQKNQGVAAARNCALSCAKGDYFIFVDGDDYIGIDYIKDMVETAIEKRAELVICGYSLVYPHKRIKKVIPRMYIQGKKEEWAYRISCVCSRLYSSVFWRKYNLHFAQEKDARAEDVPIALFSNAMAANICIISKADYFYVQHKGSAMHSNKRTVFLFPYNAFEEMYNKLYSLEITNSRCFYHIGILKFLAQFEYVLYRKAALEEKERFHYYIKNILKDDFCEMQKEWKQMQKDIDLPFLHKLAISLFCRKNI